MSTQWWNHLTTRRSEQIPVAKWHICIHPALHPATSESHHLHALHTPNFLSSWSISKGKAFKKSLCSVETHPWKHRRKPYYCLPVSTYRLRQGTNLHPQLLLHSRKIPKGPRDKAQGQWSPASIFGGERGAEQSALGLLSDIMLSGHGNQLPVWVPVSLTTYLCISVLYKLPVSLGYPYQPDPQCSPSHRGDWETILQPHSVA